MSNRRKSYRGSTSWFFIIFSKINHSRKKYYVFGYKGKQVRDNIHSLDVVKAFHEFIKRPKTGGKVYNLGGGRSNSCSILEAINLIENISNKKSKYKILKKNRLGDHKWWISNNSKFIKDYPNWKITRDIDSILEELVYSIKDN